MKCTYIEQVSREGLECSLLDVKEGESFVILNRNGYCFNWTSHMEHIGVRKNNLFLDNSGKAQPFSQPFFGEDGKHTYYRNSIHIIVRIL